MNTKCLCFFRVLKSLKPAKRAMVLFILTGLLIVDHSLVAQLEPVTIDIGTNSSSVSSTPDGNILVYQDYTIRGLFSVPATGGTPQQLTRSLSGSFFLNEYLISPDGENIIYTEYESTPNTGRGENILYVIPIEGGTPIQLTPAPTSTNFIHDFQFTPDGNTVVFLSDYEIPGTLELYAVPITGGTPVKINNTLGSKTSVVDFLLSPDGNNIIFRTSYITLSQELFSSPITGGGAVKLDSGIRTSLYKLSADGQTVVYTYVNLSSFAEELFSVPIQGGTPTKLSQNLPARRKVDAFYIGANDRIVYSVDIDQPSSRNLFSVLITGGTPIKLSSKIVFFTDIELSVDGSRVIYKDQQTRELFSQEITGGSEELIASDVISFNISPNGTDLIFTTLRELFVAPVAGGQSPVELTNPLGTSNSGFVKDVKSSPDGTNLVYIRDKSYLEEEVLFSPTQGGGSTNVGVYAKFLNDYFPTSAIEKFGFISNDSFIIVVLTQTGQVSEKNLFIHNIASSLSSATLDSPTQITVTFSEDVQTNGGNATDFTVTDAIGNTFLVSAQADGTAGDADIVLTVVDVTNAVGDLTVTYTNNNDEIIKLTTSDPVETDDTGVIIDTDMTAPTLVSATKDSETQITLTFSELIQTSGTNPTDFTVTDGLGSSFTVSTQADGTAEDTDLVLTVADLSAAVGDLTVTYTNNNNEISDFGENDLVTDATGVSIDTDNTTPMLVSATKDSDTQITITLSEHVQTNGTNPTDFTVTDGIGTDFSVSAQADGTAQDTDIVLTVADLSSAIGDLTVIYTNNNNEVSDFGGNTLASDGTGVSIDTDMTAPTLASATKDSDTQITITLSEQVQTNGTNPADFTVTDGLGATYTVSAQADGVVQDTDIVLTVADLSMAVGDLTVTYINNNNEISDFGGNDLATDATGLMIDTDVTGPTMVSAVKNSDTQITITFSEPIQTTGTNPTDFTIVDDNSTAFTVSTQADGTAEDTDLVLTVADLSSAVTQLTITYVNNNNEISDFGGNDMASDAIGIVILLDVIPPDVTLTTLANDPNSGAFDITATFTEDVMNVATSDFNVTNGSATAITGSGAVYTVTITPTADGTVSVDLPANTVQDLANNDNTASNAITLENDETAPTVAITSVANDPTRGVFDITITFSEDVTGFDISDLTVSNGAAGNFAGSASVYTATITPAADGAVTVDIAANAGQDAATNGNTAATQFSIENDETDPTITITSTVSDPTSGAFDITMTFSESVTGFDLSDLTIGNGVASNFAGSGDTYTATVTPSADGTVTIDVAAAVAQDAAGNDNIAATQFSIENDETAPTVTVTSTDNDPTSGAFDIALTFSESVTGFDISDLTVSNGTAGNFAGSGAVYTATITPAADGTVTIDVAGVVAKDAAGNDNTVATQFSIENDETAPTVSITTVANNPTSGAFDITITFSEDVSGFDIADLTIGNGVAGSFSGSGAAYTATITPAADGAVTVDIAANAGQDAATNGNTAATQFSIENDETDPTVTISSTASNPTSGAFDITVTFSEDVTGFDLADLTVSNGVAGNFSGSGAVYTATITPSADGSVTVDVAAAVAQDLASNDNIAAVQFSIENDETAPTVTVTTLANDPINVDFDITITFSEDVSGFDLADLVIANGTASNLIGSGAVYTVTITPAADGTLTVDLGAALAQDAAGNNNTAAAQFSIQADITAPVAPIITGISDDTGADATDSITNDNTQIFTGTAEASSLVEVFIDGNSIGTTTADGSGDWTFDHTVTTLSDGVKSVKASAADAAGNTSALSVAYGFTIDTVLPQKVGIGSITDDTGISNSDAITSDDLVIFYGTAEPFSVVSLEALNFVFVTAVADANGDWVADFTNRSLGLGVTVTSTSVDAAGNVSPVSDPFVLVIDKIAPQVTGITRNDVNPTAASSVDYTVSFGEEVHGLSTSNFGLALTGTQNAGIASISASSGTSFTVTVNNITGEGTFGLNLSDITGITDVAGNDLAGTFTGEVYSTNFTPTDIALSASSILENNTIGDVVATLSTTDADAGDSHTYSLVAGAGDADNASFTIAGDELKAAEAFDLETKASYDIRIQTDDGRGGVYAEAFTITIDNVPEADLRITGNNDIPATPLGITTTFDITIHNDGDATLTIGSILYPTAFGGPVTGINVAPAGSQVLTLTFTPAVAQLYTGDITINSNGGTGILAVSADGAIITGTDDGLLKAEAIQLYPNPATDIVTIDLSKYNGKPLDIQLYDMSGTKAFSISQYNEATLKLDVSSYHNGLYLVQFTDSKSTVQKKIMIRK